jgi:thiamine-phosphate diphosphorylase
MGGIPRLHVVTGDGVLAAPAVGIARALLEALGPELALHLRGPATSVGALYAAAADLAPVARSAGALLLVNDRADVALAVDAPGVQLGGRSIPVAAVRRLREDWRIGVSTHGVQETADAAGAGADFVLLGTIWETDSHPGRPGAGLDRVRGASRRVAVPVIAIGGVTPHRAGEARAAGAHGVAVVRGVWSTPDPVASARDYLAAMSTEARRE